MRETVTNNLDTTNEHLIGIKKHISTKELAKFQDGLLSGPDLEIFLEHTSSCDFCADLLAESMEDELISPPQDMKSNIMNKTKHFDVQFSKWRRVSKQKQLFQ